jgi:hypothetical protein
MAQPDVAGPSPLLTDDPEPRTPAAPPTRRADVPRTLGDQFWFDLPSRVLLLVLGVAYLAAGT